MIKYRDKKLYWSGKKFLFNFTIMICLMVSLVMLVNSTQATVGYIEQTIMVHRGDTLWKIAQTLAPNQDPRITIERLKTQNNLTGNKLLAGDKLQFTMAK
jgi:LysM repeat protein